MCTELIEHVLAITLPYHQHGYTLYTMATPYIPWLHPIYHGYTSIPHLHPHTLANTIYTSLGYTINLTTHTSS